MTMHFSLLVLALASVCVSVASAQVTSYTGTPLTRTIEAPGSQDFYGWSVASSGEYVAVGAPQCSLTYSAGSTEATASYTGNDGYVDIFQCSGETCSYISQVWGATSSYGVPNAGNGCFGYSVAFIMNSAAGSIMVVGMPSEGYNFLCL